MSSSTVSAKNIRVKSAQGGFILFASDGFEEYKFVYGKFSEVLWHLAKIYCESIFNIECYQIYLGENEYDFWGSSIVNNDVRIELVINGFIISGNEFDETVIKNTNELFAFLAKIFMWNSDKYVKGVTVKPKMKEVNNGNDVTTNKV